MSTLAIFGIGVALCIVAALLIFFMNSVIEKLFNTIGELFHRLLSRK
jgi:uncharacterized protein YggT (Ycf19 family)